MEPDFEALVELGRWLKTVGYSFTTPTPLTINRVNARPANAVANSLAGVFGWNRWFAEPMLPEALIRLMHRANIIESRQDLVRSKVRFSSLAAELYVHSAHPTAEADAVFFGPDTYRFVRLVRDVLVQRQFRPARVIDVCCGSGAGGLSIARLLPPAGQGELILSDINDRALRFASVNAAIGGRPQARIVRGDLFAGLPQADLIIANPPYLIDASERKYRHGGGTLGIDLTQRIAIEGVPHLTSGGYLILYSGTPIVSGEDCLRSHLEPALSNLHVDYSYEELDPDVFGEELDEVVYADAERIALVAVVIGPL